MVKLINILAKGGTFKQRRIEIVLISVSIR